MYDKLAIWDNQTYHTKAITEMWVDKNNNNTWTKFDSLTDDGFGTGATQCLPAAHDNMPITWGGPVVTWRSDHLQKWNFQKL
jgi:hypothetical protein